MFNIYNRAHIKISIRLYLEQGYLISAILVHAGKSMLLVQYQVSNHLNPASYRKALFLIVPWYWNQV